MVRDMTKDQPWKVILFFFIPLYIGNMFQQVYTTVDSMIVGRFVGVNAFAGISVTGSLTFLIIGFMTGMNAGFAIPIAQRFGAGDHASMRKYFANSLYLGTGISLVLTVVTMVFCRQILKAIGTPEDLMQPAFEYILIIFAGLFTNMLYNLASGVFRAVGDSKTPLFFLVFSCGLNIVLDLLCVIVFHWGAAGAAAATVFSQLVSGVLCIWYIFKRIEVLRVRGEEWKPDLARMKYLFNMGLPMGLQFSITAIGLVVVQKAVNSLGSDVVAAVGVGGKIQYLFMVAIETLGATISTYAGQNIGAGQVKRVRQGVRLSIGMALGYIVVAYGIIWLFGRPITELFIGTSQPEVVRLGVIFIRVSCAFYPSVQFLTILRSTIQSLGYSRIAMFAGIFELAGRLFASLVLVRAWGYLGAVLTTPVAWTSAAVLVIVVYLVLIRRLEQRGVRHQA